MVFLTLALSSWGCGGEPPGQPPLSDAGTESDTGPTVDACSSACSTGETRCSGEGLQTCIATASGCADWGSPTPCASGSACSNGTCPEPCSDQCSPGAVQCASGGVQTCGASPSGCADWDTAVPCGEGEICSDGACLAKCTDQCALGAQQCSGPDLQTCVKKPSGCTDWSAAVPCGAGLICGSGACVAKCTDQCALGAQQCSGNGLQTCVTDPSGCTDWSAAAPCGAGLVCSGAACVPQCADQCALGAQQCSGPDLQTCVTKPSGCTDWSAAAPCGAGLVCSGGACVLSCADQCALGAQQCSGPDLQTCVTKPSGCTDWSAAVPCGAGLICGSGACVPQCSDQCALGAVQCSGPDVQTCVTAPTGCTAWSAAVACNPGMGCSAGACVLLCTDKCALGALQCAAGGLQTCVGQASGCADWGSATPCGLGNVCDAVSPACVLEPLPPRLIAPLGGALVSGGVVFQWETDPTSSESLLDVCSDRFCANVVAQVSGPSGATLSPPLLRGTYFVRARGRRMRPDQTFLEGTKWSLTRAMFVTGRPVTSPALLGMMPDLDADGIPEKLIGNTFPPGALGATILVAWGSGASTTLTGGWNANGVRDATFASAVQNIGDFVGTGRPQLVTVKELQHSGGNFGSPTPADPITLLRFGLNPQGALVQLQTFDMAAPFHSIVPVADIDGDGYSDVLAIRRLPYVVIPPGVAAQSGVEVITLFGGPQGFFRTTTSQIIIPPTLRSGSTQVTARGVGDMDGDGFADVAIGISLNPDSCSDVPGGPPPLNRSYVDILRGGPGIPLQQTLAHFDGIGTVTPLGDIDGDGLADVGAVIPARLYMESIQAGTNCASFTRHYLSGAMIVDYGGATTPLRTSSWTLPTYNAPGCQNNWNFSTTFQIGGYVTGGGDLDADTFGDVVLATPSLFDVAGASCPSFPGRIQLFYGSAIGLASAPAQVIDGPDGDGRLFGRSAAFIGDVVGGGGDDLLVGASDWHDASHIVNTPARVRLFSGPLGGLASVQVLQSGAPAASNDNFGVRLVGGL